MRTSMSCSSCKKLVHVPKGARSTMDAHFWGHYFECPHCGSTQVAKDEITCLRLIADDGLSVEVFHVEFKDGKYRIKSALDERGLDVSKQVVERLEAQYQDALTGFYMTMRSAVLGRSVS